MLKCQLCGMDYPSPAHLEIEDINIALITRDHPEWRREDGACPACLSYYQDLGSEVGAIEA